MQRELLKETIAENGLKGRFSKPYELNFMLDCSRNAVMNLPSLKKLIDILAKCGYDCLILYMEDVFPIAFDDYFGHMRGRYTIGELKEIVRYAHASQMEVMPCFQTLAHLNQYFKWRGSNALCDCEDILLCGDPQTNAFLESVVEALCNVFDCPRYMIGMDEARLLGAGKYFDRHGFEERKEIFAKHLRRVAEILKKHGKIGMMWSDSLFTYLGKNYFTENKDESVPAWAVSSVPENIELIYWNYGQEKSSVFISKIKQHKQFKRPVHVGGSTVGPGNISPMNDLALRYLLPAMQACREEGVQSFSLYHWGDDGAELSAFAVLPSVCYCAAVSYGVDFEELFLSVTGVALADFMRMDRMNRPYSDPDKYENDIAEYFKNVSKYCLYNDVFLGLCDANISSEYAENYARLAEDLRGRGGAYAYLFETQCALAKLLAKKATIGLRLKEAYDAGDRKKMEKLCGELDEIAQLTEEFSQAFQRQWKKENKLFGLEIFHQKIGGMLYRIKYCAQQLRAFLRGECGPLEELEEKRLSFDKTLPDGKPEIPCALFVNIISANKL